MATLADLLPKQNNQNDPSVPIHLCVVTINTSKCCAPLRKSKDTQAVILSEFTKELTVVDMFYIIHNIIKRGKQDSGKVLLFLFSCHCFNSMLLFITIIVNFQHITKFLNSLNSFSFD